VLNFYTLKFACCQTDYIYCSRIGLRIPFVSHQRLSSTGHGRAVVFHLGRLHCSTNSNRRRANDEQTLLVTKLAAILPCLWLLCEIKPSSLTSRNNLLSKLAGSSWGANAGTLRTSALALCYSVAEYCCPDWFRSAHIDLVDAQLNSSMRVISGTLRPILLPWLPVLTNIPPPKLRRKPACDKLLQTVEMHRDWTVHQDFFNHPPPRLKSRKPIWSDNAPVDVVSKWKEDWQSNCN